MEEKPPFAEGEPGWIPGSACRWEPVAGVTVGFGEGLSVTVVGRSPIGLPWPDQPALQVHLGFCL